MADWQRLATYDWTCSVGSSYNYLQSSEVDARVDVEYDKDSATPTELKIRFKLWRNVSPSSTGGTDSVLILYNPKSADAPGTKIRMKAPGNKTWPFYSTNDANVGIITIKKTYTAAKFTVPAFWVCNNGNNADKDNYDTVTAARLYSKFLNTGSYRGNWSQHMAAAEYAVSGTAAAAVGAGTYACTDHYNNSYTPSGTAPDNATNNAFKEATFTYTDKDNKEQTLTTETKKYSFAPGKQTFKPSNENDTRPVSVYIDSSGTYNNPDKIGEVFNIRQYVAPGAPTAISLDSSSLQNSRFTIKKDWKFTWTAPAKKDKDCAANGRNKYSPLKGYTITIYKQTNGTGDFVTVTPKNSSGDTVSTSLTASATSFTFNPEKSGFKPKDKVKIGIQPYTQSGASNTGTQIDGTNTTYTHSKAVEYSGLMRVNVGTASKPDFKEGIVKVYVPKTAGSTVYEWKEAEVVKAYISTAVGWKEST